MGKSTKRKSSRRGQDQRDDLVFKALSNSERRRILDLVRQSPKTTGELCESIPHLDRCTVMQHLTSLERADLIICKRKGRFRWNYLNVEPIQQIYNRWIKEYAQPATELLTRLKDELEADSD
jgi:DNA-binding transcriptional ArsR family regulator